MEKAVYRLAPGLKQFMDETRAQVDQSEVYRHSPPAYDKLTRKFKDLSRSVKRTPEWEVS